MADCRKCIFYIPPENLDEQTRGKALRWIHRRRPGSKLLGWCQVYMRPITYYTGKCQSFRPKEPKTIPITSFAGGEP